MIVLLFSSGIFILVWSSLSSTIDGFYLTPTTTTITSTTTRRRRVNNRSNTKMVPVFTNENNNDSTMTTTTTTTTAEKEYDWSFLDRVYLITCPNADPDGKRLERAQEILKEANLLEMVETKAFDTDDEDRVRGCYASHISVLKDAKKDVFSTTTNTMIQEMFQTVFTTTPPMEKKKKKILVLEDNIALTGNLDGTGLQAIREYVESSDNDWDVMHLAYIPYVPSLVVSPTDDDSIVQLSCGIGSALGTTAYIIQESAVETLLRQDREQSYYAAIPDVMAELFPNTRYAAFPTPFLRAPKTKSLVNPQLDDLRELLFQPIMTSTIQLILTKSGISTNQLLPLTILSLLSVSSVAGKMSWDAISSILHTGTYDGPILLAVLSFMITFVSLAIIVQGIMLAPEPPQTATAQTTTTTES